MGYIEELIEWVCKHPAGTLEEYIKVRDALRSKYERVE